MLTHPNKGRAAEDEGESLNRRKNILFSQFGKKERKKHSCTGSIGSKGER